MYDGQVRPSSASYAIITATITGSPALGDTITGVTSTATGVVIALPGGAFVITKVAGTWQSGEVVNISGSPVATTTSVAVTSGASTQALHATYNNLAADKYRTDIAAVPGSGVIRGIYLFNDILYAFRDNAGGTACDMYKSSSSGWTQVVFEKQVTYTLGSGAALADGGTLTQGGVTATIRRVLVRTGTLAAGTAVGSIVISAPSGGNFAAGAATVGAATLTLDGAQAAITLTAGGRFEFVTENFGGAITAKRMYGCDGVSKAFEFDGNYFVPIPTGMTADTPTFIIAHRKHLFLAFAGGSVQHSSIGAPYTWSPVTGASEIAMGNTVTGFARQPGSASVGALAIFTRNRLSILYGTSSSDWVLVPYREEIGAYPYSIQDVGFTMYLDDRGISDIQTSQAFGNFSNAAISDQIKTTLNSWRLLAVASCISRDLSQYRLFFSNKQAIYVTLSKGKIIGMMPMLFVDNVRCCVSGEMASGAEVMYFGSDSGWVFQMDKGTSFDGDAIAYHIELAYNFQKSPMVNKRYHDAMLEMSGSGYNELNFGYSLDYGDTTIEQPATQSVTTNLSASAYWDTFTWDAFYWDGQTLIPNVLKMEGEAQNVSLSLRGSADYFQPFTITGALIHYSPRRRLRP